MGKLNLSHVFSVCFMIPRRVTTNFQFIPNGRSVLYHWIVDFQQQQHVVYYAVDFLVGGWMK